LKPFAAVHVFTSAFSNVSYQAAFAAGAGGRPAAIGAGAGAPAAGVRRLLALRPPERGAGLGRRRMRPRRR
jgi:hypothetical protein